MIARLQRMIAFTLLALAALWLAWTLPERRFVAAAIGIALLGGGHAVVLALEFALMHRVNRGDPAPRASVSQVVRAWWGECVSAPRVFLWRQPFRSTRWADHLPEDARGRLGVLLVHGFVCNRGLWGPWMARLHERGVPVVAVDLEPPFARIDHYVAAVEAGVARLSAATGRAPLVVAHSMGGLALRRWRAEPGNAGRLAGVLTLGTPHHGTWLARFAFSPNGNQMRRLGAWLDALQRREAKHAAADRSGFTCFYSHCDNIVFPASTATLAGADNRHLDGVAHVHMVDHEAPWAELLRWLDADARATPAAGPAAASPTA